MKIPALSMASPLAGRLLREGATLVPDIPCEAVVHVEQAYLSHHGPDQNYRPYLRLSGELRSLVPEERLPGDVHELSARPTMGPEFDVFYEFSDEQLGQMVSKGYFSRQFAVPPIMTGVEYELPVTASVLVLEPQDPQAGDVPLVFVDVHNRNELELDLESSGYDLAEYFESVRQPEREHDGDELDAEREYDGRDVDDIFNDPRFAGLREAEAVRMAALAAEAEAKAAREQDYEAGSEEDSAEFDDDQFEEAGEPAPEMSLDEIYARIVRPYVEGRVAPQPEQAQEVEPVAEEVVEPEVDEQQVEAEESDEISFDDEPEEDLGPEPISTGEADVPSPQSTAKKSTAREVSDRWERAEAEAAERAQRDSEAGFSDSQIGD